MYKKKFVAKDGTEFILREPRVTDAKLCLNMINEMAKERNLGISINKKLTLKEEKEWLNGLKKSIKKKSKVALFVEIDEKVRGNSSVERKTFKCSHRAYVGITLSKEARSKGIGTVLMNEVINLAKKRMKGLEIIELDVYEDNKRAQGLYKKLGFKRMARLPKFAKDRGKYKDTYYMQKYLK